MSSSVSLSLSLSVVSLPRSAGEWGGSTVFVVLPAALMLAGFVLDHLQVVPHHELGRSVDDVRGARLVSVLLLLLATQQQSIKNFFPNHLFAGVYKSENISGGLDPLIVYYRVIA